MCVKSKDRDINGSYISSSHSITWASRTAQSLTTFSHDVEIFLAIVTWVLTDPIIHAFFPYRGSFMTT